MYLMVYHRVVLMQATYLIRLLRQSDLVTFLRQINICRQGNVLFDLPSSHFTHCILIKEISGTSFSSAS